MAPSKGDLERGTASPLSEQALRQCMIVYGLVGNLTTAYQTYTRYVELLRRRSKKWQPDPQTVRVFEEVTRASDEA